MQKKLWFKKKTYVANPPASPCLRHERSRKADARTNFLRKFVLGGFTPAAWQGWFLMLLYILVNVLIFRMIDLWSHSGSDTLINFAPRFLLITLGLSMVCYFAGEKLKWQWGNNI